MNKQLILAVASIAAIFIIGTTVQTYAQTSQTQQTITTTTTQATVPKHQWHHNWWAWKQGQQNPGGVLTTTNITTVPATQLSSAVINNCPQTNPILLSTGQCLTQDQALAMIQSGQIAVGGTVQTQGQQVLGTPKVIQAQGYTNPFDFVGHYHKHLDTGAVITKNVTTTTTVSP